MHSTTFDDLDVTITGDGDQVDESFNELQPEYFSIVDKRQFNWTTHYHLIRPVGSGGQGIVFLSHRRGADSFTVPIAVKVFSPERYRDALNYEVDMQRIGNIAACVAQIQQEHLLTVHDFVDRSRIRMMVMEWIDGYNLSELLRDKTLERIRDRVSIKRWKYINEVIVTRGAVQHRLKPGTAVAIVRECLAALAALHREGIVHGDIKPANIMVKRTGNTKIVDIGSAFEIDDPPPHRTCTPMYAAPEVLDGAECTPRSDIASLGYVLIEMLSGRSPFVATDSLRDLLEAKRLLPQRLDSILPQEVTCNSLLMSFCRGLIAPDPMRRFPTAEDADLRQEGAAAFHRQLVKGNLASEYINDLRIWLEELRELDDLENGESSGELGTSDW